jgi:hypothetical protein
MNAAVTDLSPSISTEHVDDAPEHAPPQPANTHPAAGVAVSVVLRPAKSGAWQVGLQLSGPVSDVTVPDPDIEETVICRAARNVEAKSNVYELPAEFVAITPHQ